MQILNEMAVLYPDGWRVRDLLGAARITRKDYDGAFMAFERAVALAPDLPTPHHDAAVALHHMGRDGEALTQCRLALAAAPDYQDARALMMEIQQHGAASK
jgi:Flp pilus assembly protein TadD